MIDLTVIIGGERSGKTSHAETLAEQRSAHPVYLATSKHYDEQHTERIQNHRSNRPDYWTTVEHPRDITAPDLEDETVVIDCVTLWLTNIYDDVRDVEKALEEAKQQFNNVLTQDTTVIAVTNEIGKGGRSPNDVQRAFTDLLGWFNQCLADEANTVYVMNAGIPTKIK